LSSGCPGPAMALSASPQIIGYFKRLRMTFGACAGTMNCDRDITLHTPAIISLTRGGLDCRELHLGSLVPHGMIRETDDATSGNCILLGIVRQKATSDEEAKN
jgi:hypothetical protein